jgi:hypothetical protein
MEKERKMNLNHVDINRLQQTIKLLRELNANLVEIIETSLGGLDEHDQKKIDFLTEGIGFWSNPKNF